MQKYHTIKSFKKKKKTIINGHYTIEWLIWQARNGKFFENGDKDPLEVVDEIKFLSWKWWLSKSKMSCFLYYEWCWYPCMCMLS